MKTKQVSSLAWYNKRAVALLQVTIGLLLLYPLSLRAFDTGSLGQYGLILALLLVIVAGVGRVFSTTSKGATLTSTNTKAKGHG